MSDLGRPNVGSVPRRVHSIITRALDVAIERSQFFARAGYPDESTQEE